MLHSTTLAPSATPGIANEINAATRTLHTELNRLIIARLPLALPPYQSDPALYTIGISAFARVFYAFEAAWDHVLSSQPHNGVDPGLLTELDLLLPSNLRRTRRFRNDLEHLRSHKSTMEVAGDSQLHRLLATSLTDSTISNTPLDIYVSHIGNIIAAKPHVIIAYAWIMYMALFSGGRWIRAQLRTAGDQFWNPSTGDVCEAGYSFLTFEGEHDGEDIKNEFKLQLGKIEAMLIQSQRAEIVVEAQDVFRRTVDMIGELDDLVATAGTLTRKHQDSFAVQVAKLKTHPGDERGSTLEASLLAGLLAHAKTPLALLPVIIFILTMMMIMSTPFTWPRKYDS